MPYTKETVEKIIVRYKELLEKYRGDNFVLPTDAESVLNNNYAIESNLSGLIDEDEPATLEEILDANTEYFLDEVLRKDIFGEEDPRMGDTPDELLDFVRQIGDDIHRREAGKLSSDPARDVVLKRIKREVFDKIKNDILHEFGEHEPTGEPGMGKYGRN